MATVFDLMAVFRLDTKGFETSLNAAKSLAGKVGSGIANGLKTAAKVGTAAMGVAAAGMTALTKKAIDGYADYEQLVGGVDTLFKGASKKVQGYAKEAYKTAGLSANEYMETATSFSAALIQGLNGDTQKAADITDMAIRDMADNMNKMGSSMESIQNAYQGFSKQNYTMLDNLKLGYGGTKSEMERLLADAEKFSGIHYDISNLADVYNAIHVIQERMGITGTTSKEAAETISGSIGMLKSAWENLVTGLGNENANLDKLFGNVIDSGLTVFKNVVPRAKIIVSRLKDAIVEGVKKIPATLARIMPPQFTVAMAKVLETFRNLRGKVSENFDKIKDKFREVKDRLISAFNSISDIFSPLVEKFKSWKESFEENGGAVGAFTRGIDFLADAISNVLEFLTLVVESTADFINWIRSGTDSANAFKTILGAIIGALTAYKAIMVALKVATIAQTAATKIAAAAQALFNGVMNANPIGIVIVAIGALIGALIALYNNNEEFRAFCDEFFEMWKDGWEQVKEFFRNFVEAWKDGWETIKEKWSDFWDIWADGAQTIVDWFNAIGDFCKNAWQWGKDFINGLVGGIKSGWNELEDIGGKIYDFLHPGQDDSMVNEDDVFQNPYETETAAEFIARTGTKGVPSGMTFYGDGGIVTKPTAAIIGEDGAEAVIPLTKDSEVGRMLGGVSISFGNIYVSGTESAGNEVVRQIDEALRIWQIQQSRGIGGTTW